MTEIAVLRYPGRMDRHSLYEDDIYAWAQQQADILRRLAETHRDLPNDLDLEHVAEEIEDVGKAEFNGAKSFIRQIFVHLLKLASGPHSRDASHWRGEIEGFHGELLERLTRSMHGQIELDKLWRRALKEASLKVASEGDPSFFPAAKLRGPPLTIEELAGEDLDVDEALAKLGAALEEAPLEEGEPSGAA